MKESNPKNPQNVEKIPNIILEPKEIIIFDTKEEYEKKGDPAMIEPWKHSTGVSQGGFGLYEGKPLQSDGFTRCSAVILESSRSIGLIHVDPNDWWLSKSGKIKKYFENEVTKIILVEGDSAWRPEDIYFRLKQMNIPVNESRVIKVPSGVRYWWDLAYEPTTGTLSVHCAPEQPKHTLFRYDTGASRYSVEENKKSQEFFESRDYMPKGFREAQKHFKNQNYKLDEYMFEDWKRDADKTAKEALRFKEREGEIIVIWTPKSGFVEKIATENTQIGELIFPEWEPHHTLIFVKIPYGTDKGSETHDGFVAGFIPDTQSMMFYCEDNHLLTRDEIKQRIIASQD